MNLPSDTASADALAEDRVQLTLDIPVERLEELEALQQSLGAGSLTETFNLALALAQWAAARRAEGRVIAAVNETEGSYLELRLPVTRG